MRVRIRLEGALAWLAGRDQITLDLGGEPKVVEALRALCEEEPRLSLLFDPDTGDPRTNFLILLNGKDVDVLGGLEARLSEGDELCLIPLMRI